MGGGKVFFRFWKISFSIYFDNSVHEIPSQRKRRKVFFYFWERFFFNKNPINVGSCRCNYLTEYININEESESDKIKSDEEIELFLRNEQ